MKVRIRSFKGELMFQPAIDHTTTAAVLKAAICIVEGINEDHQRLSFRGQELTGHEPLVKYGIEDGSVIDLRLELPQANRVQPPPPPPPTPGCDQAYLIGFVLFVMFWLLK
jgi:hypothetical protein